MWLNCKLWYGQLKLTGYLLLPLRPASYISSSIAINKSTGTLEHIHYNVKHMEEHHSENHLSALETEFLTVADVAAESKGNMPPQAIIILSSTWEMRWIVLCTNMTLSLLFTKSITVLVEWLAQNKNNINNSGTR